MSFDAPAGNPPAPYAPPPGFPPGPPAPGSHVAPAPGAYGAPAPGSYLPPPVPGSYGPPAPGSYGPPTQTYPPAPAHAYGPPPAQAYGPASANADLSLTACRLCGSVPAVKTTFRGHRGMIVLMQFLSTQGPFCRDCGLGVFRHMTSRTLVQGWYGYGSMLITPITVLINLFRRNKVAKLAPPQANPYGPSRPPMDPGPRLLQRPMTWVGLLIPFALLFLLIVVVAFSGS